MSRDPNHREPGDDVVDRLLPMSADPPQLDPDARARLLARLQRSRHDELAAPAPPAAKRGPEPIMPSPARIRPIYTYALAVAASGLLVWGATSYFLSEGSGPEVPGRTDSLVATDLVNDAARPRLVALADGSTIILRQGARVHVDGPRRLHLQRGEALLEVAPGDEPFTIHSDAGEVEVRGTKFLLRRADDGLLAGVLRGELRLWNAGGEQILRAGESAHLSPGTAPVRRASERLSHEVAWARDALTDTTEGLQALRRGNLVARFPTWTREWPLPVRVMDVDVYVEDGVARTTIDQTFFNHTDHELEGVYSFPLPADAAIARLAMYVDGKLMEAGITERQEGREIYESIVYRRRDPALLEWMQGNEFRMRVFPLPARTEKRILLSYTQPLEGLYGDYSVRVPIPELDLPVGTVRYRVHVKDRTLSVDSCCVEFTVSDRGDERLAEATLHDVPVGEDLALTLYPTQAPPAVTAAVKADPGGDYVMVRARPALPRSSQHLARRWVVLHDTSASRSPQELAAQARFLRHLLRELDEADRVTLLAFDSTVRALPGGFTRVDALDPAVVEQFLAREGRDHVGASELARAVDEALALLDADAGPEAPHILYLGDGLLGAPGDPARAALRERLAAAPGVASGARATFVAAAVGDEHDLPLLDDLAAATGGLRVLLTAGADLRWQALDLAAALNTARVHDLRATLLGDGDAAVPGAVHLSRGSAVDGEAVTVLSRGTGPSGQVPKAMLLTGTLAGAAWSQRFELPPARTDAGYVPRLWARAQIEADVRRGAEAHKEEITRLGREHFLVTPYTSLLVLENDAMYRQFKVVRPDAAGWAHYAAPAEIAVVREPRGAVEAVSGQLVQRRPIGLVSDGPRPYGAIDEIDGLDNSFTGGLGLSGTGFGGAGFGDATIGLGLTGLLGKGGDGSGSGYGRGAGAGFGGRGTRVPTVRLGDLGLGPDLPTTAVPAANLVTAGELASRDRWSRGETGESAARPASRMQAARSTHFMPTFGAERRSRGHGTVGGRGQPVALHHLGDFRLGDLGEHLPALFEDGFDREREQLLAATAAAPAGSITADARELLTRARAGLAPARYAVDGGVLAIDGDGKFTRTRRIGGYLREITRYDGDTLVAGYPEIDLAATRRVGLAEPALLAQWAPWLLPSPDALARWYAVEKTGERALRLRQRGSEDVIDLELDAQLRLISMTRRGGADLVARTRFEYDDRGLTIVAGDERTRVEHTEASADLTGLDTISTTVALPLRSDPDLVAELARTTAGGPAWRALQRQRLAVQAALGQTSQQTAVLLALREHGPLTRGELALGGAGILHALPRQADPILAQLRDDPVARYLAALRKARRGQTGPLDQVAKDSKGTLPGLLASHARLLADAAKGISPQSTARLEQFLATYDHPELAYIATNQLAGHYNWLRPAAAAPAWEALAAASPTWAPVALHAAGTAYQYAGDIAAAGKRFEAGLAAAIDGGQIPVVDWAVRATIERAGGQAGWRLQWSRWRAAVQKSNDARLLIAFINAAQTLGATDEIHRVLVGAELERIDPVGGARLVLLLARAGLLADARTVLRPLLAAAPNEPALLALAAILAEHQGDLVAAADLGERALAGRGDLPLAQLRAAYRTLLDLRARVAITRDRTAKTDERDPIDLALDVAARWRAEDPDNPEIDERCAGLLFAVGQPAEALRHLDSISERHPADGSAHARVARVLEKEGRFDEADQRWQRAAAVEPTDPTWLLGRAHNRLATGDTTTARALVDQVVAGAWQQRFFAGVEEAKQLEKRLAAAP